MVMQRNNRLGLKMEWTLITGKHEFSWGNIVLVCYLSTFFKFHGGDSAKMSCLTDFFSKAAHAWKLWPFPRGRFLDIFLLFKWGKSTQIGRNPQNSEIWLLLAKNRETHFLRGTVKMFVDTVNYACIFWMLLNFISFSERVVLILSTRQI